MRAPARRPLDCQVCVVCVWCVARRCVRACVHACANACVRALRTFLSWKEGTPSSTNSPASSCAAPLSQLRRGPRDAGRCARSRPARANAAGPPRAGGVTPGAAASSAASTKLDGFVHEPPVAAAAAGAAARVRRPCSLQPGKVAAVFSTGLKKPPLRKTVCVTYFLRSACASRRHRGTSARRGQRQCPRAALVLRRAVAGSRLGSTTGSADSGRARGGASCSHSARSAQSAALAVGRDAASASACSSSRPRHPAPAPPPSSGRGPCHVLCHCRGLCLCRGPCHGRLSRPH
eukprot:scaffold88123_cov67-Phaeocystis_antarctica.AAC.3